MDTAIIYSLKSKRFHMTSRAYNIPVEEYDNEIIKRILNGDVDDFELLLNRYRDYVFKIVIKHVPYDMVEDVAHNVFINAYKSLPTFAGETPFKHWLSKIAVRGCYDFWREHYKSQEVPISSFDEEHNEWFENVVSSQSVESFKQEELQKEAREVLNWALARLSAKDRMVVSMVYLDGLSVRETADLLGWSVMNVKVRSHRAKKELRKHLVKLFKKED